MNLLLASFLFAIVLLALDLLTAPRYPEGKGRTDLKNSRHGAQ